VTAGGRPRRTPPRAESIHMMNYRARAGDVNAKMENGSGPKAAPA